MNSATLDPPPAAPADPSTGWSGAQMQLLRDAVVAACDLDDLRQAVQFGMEQALDGLVGTAGPFNEVVFAFIQVVQRAGWNERFVRAVYAYRPQNPRLRAFCEAHAGYVFASTSHQQAVNVAARIGELAGRSGKPDAPLVRDRLRAVSDGSAAALGRIDLMGKYKKLHECLHTLSVALPELLSGSVERFRTDPTRFLASPDEIRQLKRYCGDLETQAEEVVRAGRSLPEPDATDQSVWIAYLGLATASIRGGLTDRRAETADAGLNVLLRTLNQQPAQLNRTIVDLAGGLDLAAIARDLGGVVTDLPPDDPLAGRFAEALRDLERLGTGVAALVAEHDLWQQLDSPLGMIAAVTGSLPIMWPQVRALGRKLTGAYSRAEWAPRLTAQVARYDAAADSFDRLDAFDEFRQVAVRRFRAVDVELLELATTMRHIAAGFKSVLEVLARDPD